MKLKNLPESWPSYESEALVPRIFSPNLELLSEASVPRSDATVEEQPALPVQTHQVVSTAPVGGVIVLHPVPNAVIEEVHLKENEQQEEHGVGEEHDVHEADEENEENEEQEEQEHEDLEEVASEDEDEEGVESVGEESEPSAEDTLGQEVGTVESEEE